MSEERPRREASPRREAPLRRGAPLRLGLIGAGRWGRAYIRTLKSMAGVELARLCSANPESPKLAGPGCRVTGDWRELAGAEDLDGLILATPPGLHAEMAGAAAAAGLPVMIEKPLTLDLDEALRLQETFERTGTAVLV
ncbi:MAG: Gfo/Idh/MocA family oxidoreductase, partial [bacterium]